jgi:hypothetical protein
MKKIILVFLLFSHYSFSQKNTFPVINGESCSYRIHYGFINAGHAAYSVDIKGKEIRVIAQGGSNSAVDLFFKIRDRYESGINSKSLLPSYFRRDILEDDYKINQRYLFNHKNNTVETQKGEYKMKAKSQDMLSSLFFGRTLSSSFLKRKDPFFINLFIDEENYNMKIQSLGTEVLNTEIGKIRCIKLKPTVIAGRVFSNPDDLTIWISDDKNHILIRLEMNILVGSIKADIETAKNIKFPLSITD